jgi:hypothetical protein
MTNLATPGPNPEPLLAGGRRMDAGRSRVSVRRTVQALSGFAIRQRPRVGSRAVIPARIYLLDAVRGLGETHF